MDSNDRSDSRVPVIDEALRQGPIPPVQSKPVEVEIARYVPPDPAPAPTRKASHPEEPAPSRNPLSDHARELQLEAQKQDEDNPLLP
jgi:hypothetical protein